MPPTLYLIDGHALAYRTYFALTGAGTSSRRWMTSTGEPTAGVFGFTSVLLRILDQEHPDYLAVAFDTGRTFRDDMFPEYKATREKMPEDLQPQIDRIREIVDAFNIPRLEMDGYEADDVLGSVAQQAAKQGLGVKIITGDRDLLQLVDKRIFVNLPAGRSLSEAKDYSSADVESYLGVRPDQIVDYKALVGDKSDNIPGVRGVGEKTAVNLLTSYQTLDGVYDHLDELTPGVKRKLEEGREAAQLSRKLALIVTDLDIPLDLEKARIENFNPRAVESIFRQLEFRSLMKRLMDLLQTLGADGSTAKRQLTLFEEQAPRSTVTVGTGIESHIVQDAEAFQNLLNRLNAASQIAFDTETTSTDKMRADLVGISLAVDVGATAEERGWGWRGWRGTR